MLVALLVFLTLSTTDSPTRRTPVGLNTAESPQVAANRVQLLLTTEVLKENYCDGPDPDLFSFRLLLRLSFRNTGKEKVILQRGGKIISAVRISKTAEDAIENRFEKTINYSVIVSDNKRQKVSRTAPLNSFAILAPGETYQTVGEVHVPVPRNQSLEAAIDPGTHYLQAAVWTWDQSQDEAGRRRKAWREQGFFWSKSLFSEPMPFAVRSESIGEDCRCADSKVGEKDAVNIAIERMKVTGYTPALYKSVVLDQSCEWQIILEPDRNKSNIPNFTVIIDKNNGKVLADFQ